MREPETLLGRRVEAAILDHENKRVLDGHVAAAAFEAPIDESGRGDPRRGGAPPRAAEHPDLEKTNAGYVWAGRDYPAGRFGLRSTSPDVFTVVTTDTGSVLGTIERERAYSTVHEGAIYLHLGESYRVVRTRPDGAERARRAVRRRLLHADEDGDDDRDRGGAPHRASPWPGARLRPRQRHRAGDRVPEEIDPRPIDARLVQLDLPETTFETEAVWYVPEPEQLAELETDAPPPRHAARGRARDDRDSPALGDVRSLGYRGLSTNLHFQTGRPTVFVYDGHSGGVGITERGFEAFEGWVEDTAKMLAGCPCESGCPSCVQSPKCGNLNEPLDKVGALTLLQRMLASR